MSLSPKVNGLSLFIFSSLILIVASKRLKDRQARSNQEKISSSASSDSMHSSSSSSSSPPPPPTNSKTAIIVLGGGLAENGECPPHTQLRLNSAFELYKQRQNTGGAVIIPLSGGTPYKPNPVDKNGFPIWEAVAAAKQLIKMGTAPNDVLEEAFSLDTIGNAYFLRVVHTDPARLRKLIVVTNSWHMPRARAIFECIFSLPRTSQSPISNDESYLLEFEEAVAGIDDADILSARVNKEIAAAETFKAKTKNNFDSIQSLHKWLFSQHMAYSTNRHLTNDGEQQPPVTLIPEQALLLKSY